MPHEMFLTIQLMHLTSRKDHVQSSTSKERWDMFQRTRVDSSRNNSRWRIIWRYFQRKKKYQTECSYATLLSIIDVEPSIYEEVAKKKGKESTSSRRMMSRMRYRDPKGSLQWICKIQHAVDGNIVGYKERFVAWGFSWKEFIDYEETLEATWS